MNTTIPDRIVEALRSLVDRAVLWIPDLVVGAILALVALVVAKVIELVFRVVLARVRLDRLLARAGVDQTLHGFGVRQSLNEFLPRVVYFLILFLFVRTGAQVLGLDAISDAIGAALGYLPNLLAALLILLVGGAAAQFVAASATNAARDSGIEYAASLGRFVYGGLLFVLGVMAISQLRVDTEIIRLIVICGLAGLSLAFGLSFGLGTRDVTRNIVAGYYARKVLDTGRHIEIAGEQGVWVAITPTQALIRQEQRLVSVSNQALLDGIVKQQVA